MVALIFFVYGMKILLFHKIRKKGERNMHVYRKTSVERIYDGKSKRVAPKKGVEFRETEAE